MCGIRCCVLDQMAWCTGGVPSSLLYMYSWTGPGSAWTNRTEVPGPMLWHSMVCDQANNNIWTLTGFESNAVYRYSVESGRWQTMPPLPYRSVETQTVLCNNSSVIVIPGGDLPGPVTTDTILLMNTVTNKIMQSPITLSTPVRLHASACVSR